MEEKELLWGLKVCYIELIVLGGIIGVGLFMGLVSIIKWVGLLVLLVYGVVGIVMYIIMRIMGEMFYIELLIGFFVNYV